MSLGLPEGSIICADKGYTDYHHEDLLPRGQPTPESPTQEELQARDAGMGRVFGQADSPIHRDYLQQAERDVFGEDPRGDAQGLRTEDRLVRVGLLHPMPVGGNSGELYERCDVRVMGPLETSLARVRLPGLGRWRALTEPLAAVKGVPKYDPESNLQSDSLGRR